MTCWDMKDDKNTMGGDLNETKYSNYIEFIRAKTLIPLKWDNYVKHHNNFGGGLLRRKGEREMEKEKKCLAQFNRA